jgi:hypothetical protein
LKSSILILSIIFMRLVAWRAFDLLAEKRRTNSCSSATLSLALALDEAWRSLTCAEASM